MAWFKKERKPRTSERVKLEIPADAWEKCDECGHIDIKDRFVRALNVCPNCGHHRRISAQEYIDLLVDEGSWHELDGTLRSADPLTFESYRDRLEAAVRKAGPLEALRSGYARLDGMAIDLAVMDFSFMGGSMGVSRRREARPADAPLGREADRARRRLGVGRGPHAGGGAVPDADGQDVRGGRPATRGARALHLDPHQPDHRRGVGVLRDAGGRHPGRAGGGDRVRGAAGDQADDWAGPAGGLPDGRIPARARDGGRRGAAERVAGHHRSAAAAHGRPATGGG